MARSFFTTKAALVLCVALVSLATATCLVLALALDRFSRPGAQARVSAVRATAPEEGDLAPDFEIRDLEGRTYRLRDHVGKRLIIIQFGSFT